MIQVSVDAGSFAFGCNGMLLYELNCGNAIAPIHPIAIGSGDELSYTVILRNT